ncbi:Uncharacterised protein [Bordetella pertussis]|nr:Uncharacterised protein [Bordetella pertussis]CFW44883.1 Uncharacterised protein [Bordetella pertussis]
MSRPPSSSFMKRTLAASSRRVRLMRRPPDSNMWR